MAHFTQAASPTINQNYGRGGKMGELIMEEVVGMDMVEDFWEIALNANCVNPQQSIPYANSYPPPPSTSFHQPKAYLTGPTTTADSPWYADSGASHHVTAEHANIMQHSESN
ncbi:hypothetical protein PIB30_075460 [Stylosanthes scabra]|uniref:Uncharacterized protein n=1 Tax=Stylosanthes scabra TaxID=79078 RepID=A0ABU6TS58_9FABA|nr:hypothetical protein [Stylosanthes scabra]